MRAEILAVALCAALGAPQAAEAKRGQGILHKIQSDKETYARIAEHYYGQRYLGHHLRVVNRQPEPLRKGRTLIIPTTRRLPLERGQSLEAFAKRHLGRASRAAYLELLHFLKSKPPRAGKRLKVPSSLRHVVRPGENLGSIARTYYRDASGRRLALLRAYNDLGKEDVRVGAILRIPLDTGAFDHDEVQRRARGEFEPAASASMAPAASSPPPKAGSKAGPVTSAAPSKLSRKEARQHVDISERLYATGHYAQCLEYAKQVLETHDRALAQAPKVELLRLAGASLVALDRVAEAGATFAQLKQLDPDYRLDLYRTSPKVLDVFDGAK